ncbi:uncharacterized protein CELE_F48C1.3 [Caenorhabditis elegans]|uniref:Uncharacterized protein n=1 Tax=Caenorhabditis elegans TaxID=6239 RepID=O01570_CAEEL|nr:Uncharacterized protein CELE_F48C1.3 [Caenorhabditis elegans]CCD62470.1 Uncharacterized protein CELE_F48C1.3 [Caenorhabditis elegans]|eukprot:NP_491564.1 Uncharacterized protein CELE_F48C1.3 [Caenorhabditis elegans]
MHLKIYRKITIILNTFKAVCIDISIFGLYLTSKGRLFFENKINNSENLSENSKLAVLGSKLMEHCTS